LISKSTTSNRKLASIVARIQNEVSRLEKVLFYRVPRENNLQIDSLANEGTMLKIGVLQKNGAMKQQAIP
jgi:hypothetical protein